MMQVTVDQALVNSLKNFHDATVKNKNPHTQNKITEIKNVCLNCIKKGEFSRKLELGFF